MEEAIEQIAEIVEEEYEEYAMLRLAMLYVQADRKKEAVKVLRRLRRLFPDGMYQQEEAGLQEILEGKEGPGAIARIEEALKKEERKEAEHKGTGTEETQRFAGADSAKETVRSGSVKTDKRKTDQSKTNHAKEESESLAASLPVGKKQAHQSKIPRNIQECFEGTAGLWPAAVELEKFYNILRLQNERKKNDFQPALLKSTHFAVTGGRGSGKTLMADIIARLLKDFGVRSAEQPIRVQASDIYSNRLSWTKDVENIFGMAQDNVLIVENMQDILPAGENASVRQLALCLEKNLRELKESVSVILTGSQEAINQLLGATDTFVDVLYKVIEIPPYTAMDLFRIAEKLADRRALRIHPSAEAALLHKINQEYRSAGFMNAISLGRYLDEAVERMAERYSGQNSGSEADLVYLMAEDFEAGMDVESLEELLAQLDALTGLASVKEQIRKRIDAVTIENRAREAGAGRTADKSSLHMLFLGNPGTGKTTVARLIGKIYQQLGVLPRGNCMVECTRSDLVGQYQGWTAKAVQEKVREALGGVLFIDEAYALCRDDRDVFGREAVDELIAAMENNRDNLLVILAGYSEEMKEFLTRNPGFASRIRSRIVFEDYSPEEMADIFKGMVKGKKMRLQEGTEDALAQLIERRSRIPDFGNARGIRNLMEDVMEAQNSRLSKLGKMGEALLAKQYETICREDFEKVLGRKAVGEKTLEELQKELMGLTGLASVKKKVQEMVDDMTVKELMRQNQWGHAEAHGTLHLVFKGNAGTGKTTVARLLGQIYRKLGILRKDVFVETGRKDLVAEYTGQTAGRVMKKLKEAEGGILFIDEAYNLCTGQQDEFGMEAVNTLLAEMENRREDLMVIVAGYAKEMDRFLAANQGLASRFSNEIIFEDYTMEEMESIFNGLLLGRDMCLEPGLEEAVRELIGTRKASVKDFGNARGVRNIIEDLEKKKNTRIARMLREEGQLS